MARLLLIRHGEHGLVDRVLAGRMPGVDLSPAGREQAQRLAGHLQDCGATRLLSSPLERCRQTAQPLAERLGLPIETCDDLTELDCGDWTGQSFDALREDPRWAAWNSQRGAGRIPGGETMAAVQDRVMRAVRAIAATDRGPTLAFTHSDIVKTVVLTLLGASPDGHSRLEVQPASITTLDLWPGGGKLVRSNEVLP